MNIKNGLLVAFVGMGLAACGAGDVNEAEPSSESEVCEQAQVKLEQCFPDQPVAERCNETAAQEVLDKSCDELADLDTKSDGSLLCFWNPWLCTSSTPDTYTITVGTSKCGTSLAGGNDCFYYSASICAGVALYEDGVEIARGASNRNGITRFEVEEAGEYEVRVLNRYDETANQLQSNSNFTYDEVPAVGSVVLDESSEERVTFSLSHDSDEMVRRCAPLSVQMGAQSLSGEPLNSRDIEWEWLVRLHEEDGTVTVRRPLSIHPEASGEPDFVNRAHFPWVFAGEHTLEFVRVDIPSWQRTANPDLENLYERYAISSVEPYSETYTQSWDNIPSGARHTITLIDPLTD